MSTSIFHSALSKALLRRPLSSALLSRLNSTLIPRKPFRNPRAGKNAPNSSHACNPRTRKPPHSTKTPVKGKKSKYRWKPAGGSKKKSDCHITRPELLPILRSIGHARDVPGPQPGKTNLSYSDPLNPQGVRNRGWRLNRNAKLREDEWEEELEHSGAETESNSGLSLRIITERFIRTVYDKYKNSSISFRHSSEPPSDAELDLIKTVFTPPVLNYLQQKGCEPEDVMTWTWILHADSSQDALLRLQLGTAVEGQKEYRIPPFLMLHTLRRNPIPHSTLHSLLPIIRYMLSPQALVPMDDQKTILLLMIRLLRRMREYWPTGIFQVAKLFVSHFNPISADLPSKVPPARLTHTYNRILTLLSQPPLDRPFQFVPLIQRSQFLLLRKMAAVGAPITREGYRAIITVQLAHSKSGPEKDAVRNMSSNWPPWPTEKHGWQEIHRHAFEKVISRAGGVIRQMMEVGYGLRGWEKEAMILAGTDTDDSPTIQTRTFWTARRGRKNEEEGVPIWAARIRATRSTEESWAIFLACREALKSGVPARDIWEEMFEKLIARKRLEKRAEMNRNRLGMNPEPQKNQGQDPSSHRRDLLARELQKKNYTAVPGDGKEVILPPRNPSDGVYIPVPVPSTSELFTMMKRDGVVPGIRIVTLLIREVEAFPEADWILKTWKKLYHDYLLNPAAANIPPKTIRKKINRPAFAKILAAYLYALRKFHRLNEAIELLLKHEPVYPPAWNIAIAGMVKTLSTKRETRKEKLLRLRIIWRMLQRMVAVVPADTATLKTLAAAAEKCVAMGLEKHVLWGGERVPEKVISIFQKSLGMAEDQLSLSTAGDTMESESERIPPSIVPTSAAIHAYIRLLGASKKYREILQVARWLRVNEQELDLGDEMGRRVIVAMRVFLEEQGQEKEEEDMVSEGLGEEEMEIVKYWREKREERRVVEEQVREVIEAWGWPRDEEVKEYRVLGGMY
ncbi:hypothetical protein RUND412_003635 [Rhizina undulata]